MVWLPMSTSSGGSVSEVMADKGQSAGGESTAPGALSWSMSTWPGLSMEEVTSSASRIQAPL